MAQEVDGLTLSSDKVVTEESMALLGLSTIGRKARFEAEILKLKGTACELDHITTHAMCSLILSHFGKFGALLKLFLFSLHFVLMDYQ